MAKKPRPKSAGQLRSPSPTVMADSWTDTELDGTKEANAPALVADDEVDAALRESAPVDEPQQLQQSTSAANTTRSCECVFT